jgi:hypothetical protein
VEYLVRLKRHAMLPLTLNVCTVSKGSGDVTVKVHFDFTNNFLILKLLEPREESGFAAVMD